MSGSGVDWGAIAKLAGAAQSLGTSYKNAGVSGGSPIDSAPQGTPPSTYLTEEGGANSNKLNGPLSLPKGIDPGATFTWSIGNENSGDAGIVQRNSGQTLTQMTLAGSLSWLRNLASTNKNQYNEIVAGLVRAGYLTPSEARYNSYTTTVATKFLQSAIDTEQANNDIAGLSGGAVKTWWNHIDDLYQGRIDSGQLNADGSAAGGSGGGGGPAKPTRTDVFTNPEDVKASINSAAKSVLGRNLTDAEVAQFASAFHGTEQTYNDQAWAQQQANAANQSSAPPAVRAPSVSAAAQNYVDSAPTLGGERTHELLGSYIGVLRNMVGLGSGGIASAVH